MKRLLSKSLIMLIALAMLTACESESYDTGDSSYSYMKADLCEALTNGNGIVETVRLDDNTEWTLSKSISADWMEQVDTLYRALAYYNEVENAKGEARMDLVSIDQVPVVSPILVDSIKEMKTDAVDLVSLWKGKNGKYLNFRIQIKSGKIADDAVSQSLAIVETARLKSPKGSMSYLTLYHDQGDVPEYYSQTVIFSLPVSSVAADSMTVNIQTYDGIYSRSFSCKQ